MLQWKVDIATVLDFLELPDGVRKALKAEVRQAALRESPEAHFGLLEQVFETE